MIHMTGRGARSWRGGLALAALLLAAAGARAETNWVSDEVRLNLRTGPSNGYRIIATLETGDAVEVVSRGDGWIEVRAEGKSGWVPDGYLQAEPPARVKLSRLESETAELRSQAKTLGEQSAQLKTDHEQLGAREAEQRTELERLTRDNMELRAGARWPEWIAGACILGVGMALGALLRGSARRGAPRIRL
jgi:SH3 domain protein